MASRTRCAALVLLLLATPAVDRARGDDGAPRASAQATDAAAITPELAAQIFARLAPLRESDGCVLERLDTSRFRFVIGLKTATGTIYTLEAAATPVFGERGRSAGSWDLSIPPELERDCGASLAAIESLFAATDAPDGRFSAIFDQSNYTLLAATFVLLVLATLWILSREALRAGTWRAVLALTAIWAIGLALRLTLSPRTFLHEYYHIAETVPGYLSGNLGPAYGKTGPALFRLVGMALGRPNDVGVIFLTNAVFASLAIPALALFDLAVTGSWPRALLAAALLCTLPQHLRFSASEVLFMQAITFGFWALALFANYLRTTRFVDALGAALATSLAMQARPEMMLFPALPVALLLFTQPRRWRLLVAPRSLLAFAALGLLLIPRVLDLFSALEGGGAPAAMGLDLGRFVHHLVLFDEHVTPATYWIALGLGLLWGLWHQPRLMLWVIAIFTGFSYFSLTLFDNAPYNLRSQLLPVSFTPLIGAGLAPLWMALWGQRRAQGARVGLALLAILCGATVVRARPFITELRDQQLEYAFLDRSVAQLPASGRLLAATDMGGSNLDAFPEFLLQREDKSYRLTDIRRAFAGETDWPTAGEDLIFYQGMFCYFSLEPGTQVDPMTPPCAAVHERYTAEPIIVEDLDAKGYSELHYARDGRGPYRIGFFRLRARHANGGTPR